MNLKSLSDEANRMIREAIDRLGDSFTTGEYQYQIRALTGSPKTPHSYVAEQQLEESGLVKRQDDGTWRKTGGGLELEYESYLVTLEVRFRVECPDEVNAQAKALVGLAGIVDDKYRKQLGADVVACVKE